MLESAERLTLPPGSNLSGGTDTTWLHLLPSLDMGTVVCVGAPPPDSDRLIRHHADRVIVVEPRQTPPPDAIGDCDLLLLAAWAPDDVDWVVDSLTPLLGDVATVALLPGGGERTSIGGGPSSKALGSLQQIVDERSGWYLIPARQTSRVAVKRLKRGLMLGRARVSNLLGSRLSAASSHASDLITYQPIAADGASWRLRGTVLNSATHFSELPEYLVNLGADQGVKLDGRPWSYGPGRGFRSQKIIFTVTTNPPKDDLIIKSTQDPRFNDRLAAEVAALTEIPRIGTDDAFEVPEVRFFGEHAGLLLVAETRLDGAPFRQVAEPNPMGRHFEAGIDAITTLGSTTIRQTDAGELGAAADALFNAYCTIFSPPDEVTDALGATVHRLGSVSGPAVLQHGDAGVWNLLVGTDGAPIGILDWENADTAGMPLWDLFVFARTFGVFMADSAGVRYDPSVFRRQLLEPSPLQSALSEATRRYCTTLGIDTDTASDLFTLCWVQQAVREAATLPTRSWTTGRNNRYIEACLETPFRASP